MGDSAADEAEWMPEVEAFERALGAVEEKLSPLLSEAPEDVRARLSPLEHAKLELTLAYAMNSLFWMYLATQGKKPSEHPVRAEMARIKEYMQKIKRLENENDDGTGNAPSSLSQQQAVANAEAAESFIAEASQELSVAAAAAAAGQKRKATTAVAAAEAVESTTNKRPASGKKKRSKSSKKRR